MVTWGAPDNNHGGEGLTFRPEQSQAWTPDCWIIGGKVRQLEQIEMSPEIYSGILGAWRDVSQQDLTSKARTSIDCRLRGLILLLHTYWDWLLANWIWEFELKNQYVEMVKSVSLVPMFTWRAVCLLCNQTWSDCPDLWTWTLSAVLHDLTLTSRRSGQYLANI